MSCSGDVAVVYVKSTSSVPFCLIPLGLFVRVHNLQRMNRLPHPEIPSEGLKHSATAWWEVFSDAWRFWVALLYPDVQGGKNFPNGKDSWNLYGGSWCEFLPKVISNTFLWFHLMILPITNGKNSWTCIVDGKFKLSHSFTRALSVVPGIFSNSMTHLMSLRPKDHGIEQLGILATGLVWELATSCLPFDTANPGNSTCQLQNVLFWYFSCSRFVPDVFGDISLFVAKKQGSWWWWKTPSVLQFFVGDFRAA